jgi:hypothetical protein
LSRKENSPKIASKTPHPENSTILTHKPIANRDFQYSSNSPRSRKEAQNKPETPIWKTNPPTPQGPKNMQSQKQPENMPNLLENTLKTATSFVKIVRGRGRGYTSQTRVFAHMPQSP